MIIQKLNRSGINVFCLDNQAELKDCQSEDAEQIQFTIDIKYKYPELLYFHPVNEGKGNVQYGDKKNKKGLLKGVSDIVILTPSRHYNFLAIELKREKVSKSSISKEQKEFIARAKKNGGFACVAYGAEAATFVVEQYIDNCLTFVS